MTDLGLLRVAECAEAAACIKALTTNKESDWAHAEQMREACEKMRSTLGLDLDHPPLASS